jgi:hypothetical protein
MSDTAGGLREVARHGASVLRDRLFFLELYPLESWSAWAL